LPHSFAAIVNGQTEEKTGSDLAATSLGKGITAEEDHLQGLEARWANLSIGDQGEDAGEVEGRAEALQQIEQERKTAMESKKFQEELLSMFQEEVKARAAERNSGHSTTTGNVTFGSHNSGLQSGVLHGGVTFGRN
jgi:hypothetical protein